MFRFNTRVVCIGIQICKKSCHVTCTSANSPFLKIIQPSVQMATLDSLKKSKEGFTSHVLSIANSVQDLGFNENEIKMVIKEQPDLTKTSPALWNSVLSSLMCFGLEKNNILHMLKKWPHFLFLKKSEIDKNLEAWFRCGFGEELTFEILTTHPYFLQVNHLLVETRIKQYQLYFESKKRVGKLLIRAPNTLEEDWTVLMEKLNYLDELCTEKSDVASTGVLAHSALHIKARHEFLIRAGIYKRPAKDFRKRLSKNPKLTNIVNLGDEEFAYKLAGLSLLEYEVFFELFEKDYEESKNHHLDSSDDEEELNKLSYAKHLKNLPRDKGAL